MIAWTDDRKKRLARLAADGYSAREAAEILGCTEDAASRAASRLGIRFHSVPWNAWKPAEDRGLSRGLDDGLSYSLIAAEIGKSKNSCIGRARRLGLAPAGQPKRQPVQFQPRTRRAADADHAVRMRLLRKQARAETPKPARKPAVSIPESQPVRLVSFDDLTPAHCKWPYGDPKQPGFGYCGQHRVTGSSYCEGHRAMSIGNGTPSERAAVREAGRVAA